MIRRSFVKAAVAATGMAFVPALGRSAFARHESASPGAEAATPASMGSGMREITVDGQPIAISPDGKWLAGPGPDDDFCIWDVETLTPRCASDRRPMAVQLETITWAPDSSAVAFTLDAARLLRDSDIYVMDIDGTLHDLTDDGPDDKLSLASDGPDIPVDMYPAWSPDSTQLAFARTNWGGGEKATTIMTIAREGGDPAEWFVVSPQEPFIIYSPMHWLANGDLIFSVLHADPSNKQNGVWRLSSSGGVTRILEGDEAATVPMPFGNDVSADGQYAAIYSYSRLGAFDGTEPIFFILDLESGAVVEVESSDTDPSVRIFTGGRFLPDEHSILSLESDGSLYRLARTRVNGMPVGRLDLPQDVGMQAFYRGFTMADDGTVFIPTAKPDDNRQRGGIFVDGTTVGS